LSCIDPFKGPINSINQVIYVINQLVALVNICFDEISGTVKETFTAGAALSTHRVVYIKSDGTIDHADKDAAIDFNDILGFTTNNALAGQEVEVVVFGRLEGAALGSVASSYWLGNNGQVVTTAPTSGIVLSVGTQMSASDVFVKLGQPIRRA
jgi:hypothetical protein